MHYIQFVVVNTVSADALAIFHARLSAGTMVILDYYILHNCLQNVLFICIKYSFRKLVDSISHNDNQDLILFDDWEFLHSGWFWSQTNVYTYMYISSAYVMHCCVCNM